MSSSFVSREPESTELPDDDSNSKKMRTNARKYWQRASAVYLSGLRFLQSSSQAYAKKKSYTEIASSSSDNVINVEPESTEFKIDQITLTQLIEEENMLLLEELGRVHGIAVALKTDLVNGIHDEIENIAHRREVFGANILQFPPKKKFFQLVWKALLELNIVILVICGSVSLGLGIKVDGTKDGWKDGGSILIGVCFASIVIAISDCWHDRVFEKLLKDSYKVEIDVVRNGHCKQVPVTEIVVGDIVCLKYGDKVPAHGLLLEDHSLELQQVDKTSRKRDQGDHVELNPIKNSPFLFSGTKVVDGVARMLVTSVGMNARWGQMMSQISHNSNKPTPLEDRLEEVVSIKDKLGSLEDRLEGMDSTMDKLVYVVTLVLVLFSFTGNLSFTVEDKNGDQQPATGLAKIYAIVGIVVGLITSAVNIADPLNLSLKLTRTYAMKKLKAKNAIVRELSALDTMSFITTICINKTGTLSMNHMTVAKFFLGNDFEAEEACSSINPKLKILLQEGIALNTISSTPTEKAILSWAFKDSESEKAEIKRSHDILRTVPFSSKTKQSWILARRKADNTIHVHLKGAADLLSTMCSYYYDASGITKALDDNQRMKFKQVIRHMATSKLRCIAFAHKEAGTKEVQDENKVEMLKDGMTLLGIMGISDPDRPGVKDAVKDLQKAGVKVKLITGENIFTAEVIATECGILAPDTKDNEAVIEGEKFRKYSPEERREKVDGICVMANASPDDKLLMVQCLRQKDLVVAVAGNGANNSSAMKSADVGVFMGIQFTEVTEENSDIVISDGNFRTIPEVLKWARCVYSGLQKFIQFQLTVSFSALLSNSIGLFSGQNLTLTTVQLLWVSLITDTLACLAFATEKPTKELMTNPPVCMMNPLLTNIMLRNILPQALFQTALLFKILDEIIGFSADDEKVLLTFVFTSYVLCQVFNQVNARKLETKNVFEKIHKNKLLWGIIVVIIILQILLVELLKRIADTKRLNWPQWGLSIAIAGLTLPIGLVARYIPVPKKQVVSYLMVVQTFGKSMLKKLTSPLIRRYRVMFRMQSNRQRGEFPAETNHE
ncbi:P-type ATPase [Parasponia andersonii]|uniref:Calcium-transporting ATPase n=1 Tax=Parasponia andersonii TaxID=3476 RepID=A0A2P5E333_PARAD|nr:P-type ATPase [Parasponia andersonii]